MKLKKLIPPMLTALAWFSVETVQAAPNPVLQFTEISDTELKVTLAGVDSGIVKNIGPDHWEWHSGIFLNQRLLPLQEPTESLIPFGAAQWLEPENDLLVNLVTFGFFPEIVLADFKSSQVGPEIGAVIFSDLPFVDNVPSYPNGQPGGDVILGDLTVTPIFSDTGDQPTGAPDSGSTYVLLLGASVGLFGLSRVRSTVKV